MTFHLMRCGALALGLAISGSAASAQQGAPVATAPAAAQTRLAPEGIQPDKINGVILHVADLAKQKDFYVNVLGMTVVSNVGQGETILTTAATPAEAVTVLILHKQDREAGATGFGRIILGSRDVPALLAHLTALGYPSQRVGLGQVFKDPEGNEIEMFVGR